MNIKKNLAYIFLNALAFFVFVGLGFLIGSSGGDMGYGYGVLFASAGLGVILPFSLSVLILILKRWLKDCIIGVIIHGILALCSVVFLVSLNF